MTIVEGQKVEVKWHYSNKEWFINLGYSFSKYNDTISVNISELMGASKSKIKVNCDQCGCMYEQQYCVANNRTNHFCNRKCYHKFREINGSPNNTRLKINCSYCNDLFEIQSYRVEALEKGEVNSLCCSRVCQNKLIGLNNRGENHKNYKGNITLKCQYCEDDFEVAFNRKETAKYCSVKCQRKGVGLQNIPTKLKTISCTTCGENFQQWEHNINKYETHYCSIKCRTKNQGYFLSKQNRDTECQRVLNNLLDELNINYVNEKPYVYYAVDNYLTDFNLIIEVMGDYWHANPKTYTSYECLNEMQRKRVKTDKSKKSFLDNKYGIKVLYLWESDLLDRSQLCKEIIINYILNKGSLDDYNSFNFFYDGDLKVKQDIVLPYFMKKNTKKQVIS
jgi:G:T-mismatch repair DNA endonuclease (very short patch repair protein)